MKRDDRLFLRVTPTEMATYSACAKQDGIPLSAWARQALNIRVGLYQLPPSPEPAEEESRAESDAPKARVIKDEASADFDFMRKESQ